jgi:hypothetical protein
MGLKLVRRKFRRILYTMLTRGLNSTTANKLTGFNLAFVILTTLLAFVIIIVVAITSTRESCLPGFLV